MSSVPLCELYHVPDEVIEKLTDSDHLNKTYLIRRGDIEVKSHTEPDRSFI